MTFAEYLSAAITLCAAAWPSMPMVSPHMVVIEALRVVGLVVSVAAGIYLIAIGLWEMWRDGSV